MSCLSVIALHLRHTVPIKIVVLFLFSSFFFSFFFCFFFNDTATTEIYTLSLHDALPILVAMGTDILVGLQVVMEQHLATIGAFHPEIIGSIQIGRAHV